MTRTLSQALASCLLLIPCSIAAQPGPVPARSLTVLCGKLIDGASDSLLENVVIHVEEGLFRQVTPHFQPTAGSNVDLDLREYTCLPGLIDLHTHLTDQPGDTADLSVYYRRSMAEQLTIAEESARATLMAGFTTVRDVGTYLAWTDRELRDAIDAGRIVGPRMQVSGFYLTVPGGGGDLVIPGHDETAIPTYLRQGVARGPLAFAERAREAADGGADVIKVIASGAVLAFGGIPGQPEMTPEELGAVVRVASQRGLRVAAHAHGAQSVIEAIEAGVTTIEHASLINETGLRLARERGVTLVMDVYNGDYIANEGRKQGWPAEFLRKNDETTEAQRQAFQRAVELGVTIAFGSDSAVYPHGMNARQFSIMVARGMTPMQAIKSATSVAARTMGWDDRVGRVAPGLNADLIAVKDDPLQRISSLEEVAVVIKGGAVYRAPEAGNVTP